MANRESGTHDGMAASEQSNPQAQDPVDEATRAELAALRAQVAQLTAAGHEFIGTQTRMQSLLHRASDVIIQFEADGTVSGFNSAAERIFDIAEIEVLHQHADGLFDMPDAFLGNVPGFLLDYVRTTADQYASPLTGLRRDGGKVSFTVSVAEIASQDLVMFDDFTDIEIPRKHEYEAFLCILHDVTERKQIDEELSLHREHLEQLVDEQTREIRSAQQQAERANLAKSEFLASMSHELRTPMHAILSYSEFGQRKLHKAPLDKLGQYFDRIQTAGERLLAMINDLLDLAKAEAGREICEIRDADLGEVIKNVIDEDEGLAEKHAVRLVYHCAADDTQAAFDADKMGQVIRNLLSNAIKFSPHGGRIDITLSADDKDWIELCVADQGPGIPEDERESVFEKFVQGRGNGYAAGGTGLGLAIAKQVVVAHGGSIGAANNATGGARFAVRFPRRPE